jgi:hypothetical protein
LVNITLRQTTGPAIQSAIRQEPRQGPCRREFDAIIPTMPQAQARADPLANPGLNCIALRADLKDNERPFRNIDS